VIPANPIPAACLGRARILRDRISRAEAHYEQVCADILRPLYPRDGWPTPTRRQYLAKLALRYGVQLESSPCRLFCIAELTGKKLTIRDLYMNASRVTEEGWDTEQPAIDILCRTIDCPPGPGERLEQLVRLSTVLFHALGRRFQRAGGDEREVYDDLRAIGRECLRAISAGIPPAGTEYSIETAGGAWRGALVDSLTVRTFV
jgi:hypothetical protein